MTARKMVRNLRDSGTLDAPPSPAWRSTIVIFIGTVAFGAIACLGAIHGVPLLLKAMEKPPQIVSYAKPG